MSLGSPQWMYKSGEAFTIDQSLKLNDGSSSRLVRTFGTPTSTKKFSFSFWFKRSQIAEGYYIGGHSQQNILSVGSSGSNYAEIAIGNNDYLYVHDYAGGYKLRYYRDNYRLHDVSAWMHILMAVDTTQSTAAERVRIYFNGVEQTTWNVATDPALNSDLGWFNDDSEWTIGSQFTHTSNFFDGYLAELHYIDGTQLTPADFGETGDYGEWKPKEVSGLTYGNNGFYLPFKADYEVEGFSATVYKGNGANRYIGGVGFQPDLTWIKMRDGTDEARIMDSVRGIPYSSKPTNTAEDNDETTGLTARNPDGFSLGSSGAYNNSSNKFVAWNWDMGANSPTGFGCVTYRGNGVDEAAGGMLVGGIGFAPDLVWIKRTDGTADHSIYDTLRGVNQKLKSNETDAEFDDNNSLIRFDRDGFTVADDASTGANGSNYVAWCWNMGGTSVANTTGTINSTVRANTTYGQSIVTYTGNATSGATVGHGLSSAPEWVVVKRRDTAGGNWITTTDEAGWGNRLQLDDTSSAGSATWAFNNTAPTSSVFSLGNDNAVNQSTKLFVAYCFHSVTGYSKIGGYTGNGGSATITVTTGFRPAWIMVKRTDASSNWLIFDTTRQPFGDANHVLDESIYADLGNAVGTDNDFVKLTDTSFIVQDNDFGFCNASGGEYIYIAFAGGADAVSTYNTTGTIDSRVKASTTYGQSIISWTGTGATGTVGTGLTSDAEFVIVKNRSTTDNWSSSTTVIDGSVDGLYFNAAGAFEDWSARVDPSSATSNTIGVYDWDDGNKSGSSMIAYAFHSVTGYSKIGSYTGDGGSSNTITTGFKPAFVIIKNTSTGARPWVIFDGVRSGGLVWNDYLKVNESEAETVDNTNRKITVSDTGFTPGIDAWVNQNESVFVYIAFADKREYAYWLDQSGNNNDFTSVHLTESNISVDSPTNNFCTWNSQTKPANTNTLSEGNLKANSSADWSGRLGTFSVSSGKWYWEISEGDQTDAEQSLHNGVCVDDIEQDHQTFQALSGSIAYQANGQIRVDNSVTETVTAYYTTDIVGVALDLDSGTNTVKFYRNNVLQVTKNLPSSFTGKAVVPFVSAYQHYIMANFGQDSSFAGQKTAQGYQDGNDIGDFYYEPPTGYLALCTSNLPEPAVVPSEHFNTVLYTGDGTGTQAQTGVGFEPDMIWVKSRNAANYHGIADQVRGVDKFLYPNDTLAEETNSTDYINSFDSDGFTHGSNGTVGQNTITYVAWNWKAGSSVSGNTSGSGDDNAYTGSVNTDAGFSIIRYGGNDTAGHQIPHHLGVVPDAIFIKNLTTQSWQCFFPNVSSMGATKGLQLDNTGAANTVSWINDTMPTTSVVYLSAGAATNASNDLTPPQPYIMYCWKSIEGYSKVGQYEGNGNAHYGTYVYTGFRPKMIIVKNIDAGSDWSIVDVVRSPRNVSQQKKKLEANSNAAETDAAVNTVDMLSNGFSMRNTTTDMNASNTYIYIAFAETPFKYSNAR